MGKLLEIVGGLTVILALLYVGVVKSAFQETTVAILWCGGWLIIGAGVVVRKLEVKPVSAVITPSTSARAEPRL